MNAFFCSEKNKIIFILLFCSVLWFSFISLNGENSNATANMNLMLLYIWHYWKMLCAWGYFANETIELNFVMHCTVPSVTAKCCYHFKDSFLMEMSSKLFFYFYSIENWIKQWNILYLIFSIDMAAGPKNEHCFDLNIDFYQNDVVEPRPTVSMR